MAAVALLVTGASGCWLQSGYNPGKGGYNDRESTVTAANVAALTEAWSVDVGPTRAREPLVSGGSAFVRTPNSLTALDLATGATLWTNTSLPGSALPAIAGGALWVPTFTFGATGGTDGWCAVARVDLATGAVTDRSDQLGWYGSSIAPGAFNTVCTVTDALAVGDTVVVGTFSLQQWMEPVSGCRHAAGATGLVFLGPSGVQGEGGRVHDAGCLGTPPLDPTFAPAAVGDVVVTAVGDELRFYPLSCDGSCAAAAAFDLADDDIRSVTRVDGSTEVAVAHADGTVELVQGLTNPYLSGTFSVGAPLSWPLASVEGRVHAAGTDGRFVCRCGSSDWSATLSAPASSRASIAGGVVYVGSSDGTVAAFPAFGCDAPECEALWTANVGAQANAVSISDGTLLVAAADGSVTAFTL